jgi:malonyl CoA-acyl carrier protein transacylase
VSAFGFGGTNFHAVLSAYDGGPEPDQGLAEWPAELFVFRGADRDAAVDQVRHLEDLLTANDGAGRPWKLRDLAWTAWNNGRGPVQLALVATDLDDLAAKLHAPTGSGVFPAGEGAGGDVAFLFPGQGSQAPGMLADLFVAFPPLRQFLDGHDSLAATMFPAAAFSRAEADRQRAAVTDTRVAQPALGVAGLAIHSLLETVGVRPAMAGGHSYGELVALAAAGAIAAEDLVPISAARADAILAAAGADPGAMAAVASPAAVVAGVIGDDVVIANHNAPNQVVISGPTTAIDTAVADLAAAGLAAKRIPVACAFHSPLVAAGAPIFAASLGGVRAPAFPVWSNTTAAPYPNDPAQVRAVLAGQLAAPVRFVDQVEAMYAAGARVFVEAGPGRVLTGLVGKILGARPHVAVACDVAGEAGLPRFLLALAELAAAGVAVDAEPLWRGRGARTVTVATTPRRPGWILNGHLVRTADGAPLAGGLQPMTTVPRPAAAAPAAGQRDTAVLEFLRSTRELVAAQRDVLLGYLGSGGENGAVLRAGREPITAVAVRSEVVATPAVSTPPPAAPSGPLTREQILVAVMAIVSQRTGYPSDMLEPDLDLEADLSIDSIKRTEILGELAERVGLAGADGATIDESTVEELARLKTLNGIADWIVAHTAAPETPAAAGAAAESPVGPATTPAPASPAPTRQLVEPAPLPDPDGDPAVVAGRRYVIVDGGLGIGLELAELLEQRGAETVILDPDAGALSLAGAHAVVHLAAIDPDQPPVLPGAFAILREATEQGVARLLVATGAGSSDGGLGLAGLVRTIRAEYPGVISQVVDVDPKQRAGAVAAALLAELTATAPPATVVYTAAGRSTCRVVTAELGRARGAAADDIAAGAAGLGLGPDSVVLLTGGARGITSKVAVALRQATGCRIELMGRTPAPAEEDPATADAVDGPAIRQALIAAGTRVPSQIEVATARILASREMGATLRQLGDGARYHAVDVRDGAAVRSVVADVYARHGRLDGVIHGAGVLEDKRMSDKSVESFERVFRTKVDGARNLVSALRPDLGFLVLFASVAGVFGNRGQADYAAANDALDSLAADWTRRFDGRVVSVDWGPWAGAGMVSPELEREYARRGIGLISVDEGVACLLRELAWGPRDVSQVVYLSNPAAGQ